ncbi:MAG TPA: four helix bundle protein [Cytophagales bacterium]|nr:four helix bundle protein [Cytophagales bacterium]
MMNRKYDLEERLIAFAVRIVTLVESLPNNKASTHLGNQLLRSGTSPSLLYGEAQGAESRKDFTHKLGIILKELRETSINIRILQHLSYCQHEDILNETKELIAIFTKSLITTRQNTQKRNH